MNVSQHFTLAELTASETATAHGLDNTPTPEQEANLKRLAVELLEPIRLLLGCPIRVNVGYRSPQVNALVGGVANSAHLDGRAADLLPLGMAIEDAFYKLKRSVLPYDQCILETGCIHVAIAADGADPRGDVLRRLGDRGAWTYELA